MLGVSIVSKRGGGCTGLWSGSARRSRRPAPDVLPAQKAPAGICADRDVVVVAAAQPVGPGEEPLAGDAGQSISMVVHDDRRHVVGDRMFGRLPEGTNGLDAVMGAKLERRGVENRLRREDVRQPIPRPRIEDVAVSAEKLVDFGDGLARRGDGHERVLRRIALIQARYQAASASATVARAEFTRCTDRAGPCRNPSAREGARVIATDVAFGGITDGANMSPFGCMGCPDDITAMAVQLASHDSAYVTGADMVVEGGMLAIHQGH